jgi:nitrogen regulatory protein PII
MLLMVLEDEDVPKVVETVMEAARTGNIGDGRIFVTDVLDAYTIRTGERGL